MVNKDPAVQSRSRAEIEEEREAYIQSIDWAQVIGGLGLIVAAIYMVAVAVNAVIPVF